MTLRLTGSAFATQDLPASAAPIPAAELTKAYAGKTTLMKEGGIYWGADGKAIGYTAQDELFSKAIWEGVAEGTWEAVDGKVCFHATWRVTKAGVKPYAATTCTGYRRDGQRLFHRVTSDKTTDEAGWLSGPSDLLTLKPGNRILARYNAAKKKLP